VDIRNPLKYYTIKYFYLIQCNEYYKIGKTHNYPLTRLKKAYGIGHKIYLVLQVNSDDFEEWLNDKPGWVRAALYDNLDVDDASAALDWYKLEKENYPDHKNHDNSLDHCVCRDYVGVDKF